MAPTRASPAGTVAMRYSRFVAGPLDSSTTWPHSYTPVINMRTTLVSNTQSELLSLARGAYLPVEDT